MCGLSSYVVSLVWFTNIMPSSEKLSRKLFQNILGEFLHAVCEVLENIDTLIILLKIISWGTRNYDGLVSVDL